MKRAIALLQTNIHYTLNANEGEDGSSIFRSI